MEGTMTRDEFNAGLDRYGGGLSRWPPALAREAEALVAADMQAAAELQAAVRLDALLMQVTAPAPVDAALIGRIVARGRAGRGETALRPTRRLAGWVSAAAAVMLMTGFAAGAVVPPDESNDAVAALLFSATDEDLGGDLL
jgi:hypothetical protein